MGDVAWWQGAVVYQIYPLSWADSNGDGWGDLPGITERLGHLAGEPDSLGVDAIWLSPIYRSPMVDFGYDIADHRDVDPRFGTLSDFDRLLAEAHRRGLRVLLDYVPNHTSDRHPWFTRSRSSRDDPYRDWYYWADPAPDGGPPNNWLSAFERTGAAWTFDEPTGQWYLHSFTAEQPDLNWRNPATREAMLDVLRFWLDRGVDGFRIDVPHRLGKHPELADNPPEVAMLRRNTQVDERRHHSMDHPDGHELMRAIRATVDEYPDRVLVGEVGIHHPERRLAYHGTDGDELHLIFDFGFWSNPWRAESFRRAGEHLSHHADITRWPTHTLSNHDISRHAHRYVVAGGTGPLNPAAAVAASLLDGQTSCVDGRESLVDGPTSPVDGDGSRDGLAERRARVAAVMLLTLPGTTFLYYGEEIGMLDVAVPDELARDPDGRDPCRTPMRWRPGTGAGFTTGYPWLPAGTGPTVEEQALDPDSVLSLYRRLLRLRRADERLRLGGFRVLPARPDVYAYLREGPDAHVLVALNFASGEREVGLGTGVTGVLLAGTGGRPLGSLVPLNDLVLAGDEAVVLDVPGGAF